MRSLILFSVAAGLLGGLLPEGRAAEGVQAVMGLMAVRLVCGLIRACLRLQP